MLPPGSKVGDAAIVKILPYPLANIVLKGTVKTILGKNNAIQLNRNTENNREILSISVRVHWE